MGRGGEGRGGITEREGGGRERLTLAAFLAISAITTIYVRHVVYCM